MYIFYQCIWMRRTKKLLQAQHYFSSCFWWWLRLQNKIYHSTAASRIIYWTRMHFSCRLCCLTFCITSTCNILRIPFRITNFYLQPTHSSSNPTHHHHQHLNILNCYNYHSASCEVSSFFNKSTILSTSFSTLLCIL